MHGNLSKTLRLAARAPVWGFCNVALQNNACVRLPDLLVCASQQGGSAALFAFLDVSSLNLAALQSAAIFFSGRRQSLFYGLSAMLHCKNVLARGCRISYFVHRSKAALPRCLLSWTFPP
jgi:hypothetical protein